MMALDRAGRRRLEEEKQRCRQKANDANCSSRIIQPNQLT